MISFLIACFLSKLHIWFPTRLYGGSLLRYGSFLRCYVSFSVLWFLFKLYGSFPSCMFLWCKVHFLRCTISFLVVWFFSQLYDLYGSFLCRMVPFSVALFLSQLYGSLLRCLFPLWLFVSFLRSIVPIVE